MNGPQYIEDRRPAVWKGDFVLLDNAAIQRNIHEKISSQGREDRGLQVEHSKRQCSDLTSHGDCHCRHRGRHGHSAVRTHVCTRDTLISVSLCRRLSPRSSVTVSASLASRWRGTRLYPAGTADRVRCTLNVRYRDRAVLALPRLTKEQRCVRTFC